MEKQLKHLTLTVAFLDDRTQIEFLRNWLKTIKGNKTLLKRMLIQVANTYHPSFKIEKWMESRLSKDINLVPKRLAYECRYYKRIDRRMEPHLRHLARKVKRKMLTKLRRNLAKQYNNEKRQKEQTFRIENEVIVDY